MKFKIRIEINKVENKETNPLEGKLRVSSLISFLIGLIIKLQKYINFTCL